MRIELTVHGPAGSRDVAIVAPASTPLAAVADELAAMAGVAAGAGLWTGDRLLKPDVCLAEAGLRTGTVLTAEAAQFRAANTGAPSLHVIGGPDAGRCIPLDRGRLTVGRDVGCTLVLADDSTSRVHAELVVDRGSVTLHDLSSTNGTLVDGVRVGAGGLRLQPDQVIRVGDSLLAVSGNEHVPAALVPTPESVLVNRAPRRSAAVAAREIVLPPPTESPRPRRVQWVTAALPAVAGGAIALVTHSPQFLLFALLSPVMMLSSSLGDRAHWRRSRRQDAATYRRRRAAAERQIAEGLAAEVTARRCNAPDAVALWRSAMTPTSRIWERRRSDADHLCLRLGSADLSSILQVRAGSSVGSAGTAHAVPLCVDLRVGPLGLAGPTDIVEGLARWLIAQLAVLHSPADVELVLLLSAESAARWTWARWLPHLGGRVATCPADWQSLVADLTASVEQRRAARKLDPRGWAGTWTVLVVDAAAQLTDVPGLAGLLSTGAMVGLTGVCIDLDPQALPTACTTVARVRGEAGTRASLNLNRGPDLDAAVLDRVSPAWAEDVARALAPLVDAGADTSAALPATCSLLDLLDLADLDANKIARLWAASSGRPDTVLGGSADGSLRVDLMADGPHALVAGTTGSGKSELLQTLVGGLAALHPPDALTFLLIDYKGGAAFAECSRLPHTAGLVTDLDSHLTRRALRSLDAELRRRERLLAAAGAADLEGYTASAQHEPVARLVIVVDEFAALAVELPEFVQGLVGVAQRGRSLGVHLVLATQRPGSAVSAEIRANTTLRIALRVTNPAESNDVIDAPAAAAIERSRPGRAYLRAGSTLTCFQTARIGGGASTATTPVVELLGDWRRTSSVQHRTGGDDLVRLVDAVRATARATERSSARRPWLDPLPADLAAADLPRPTEANAVAIGLLDRPAEQTQPPLTVDLASGSSVLIVGAPGSGRTSALVAVAVGAATKLAPDRLEIYVLDPSGAFAAALAGLPHIATTAGPDESALVETLLRRLGTVAARRVADQSRSDGRAASRMLLLVDAWDSFLAGQDDVDAGRCSDLLADLVRAGVAAGLTTVVAGGRSLLAPRIAAAFGSRLLLRLTDRSDYGLVGVPVRDVPSVLPPGRGVRASDAAEFQIAHVGTAPGAAQTTREVQALARRWSTATSSDTALRLRSLPEQVPLARLPRNTDRLFLGLGGDTAAPLSIDLFSGSRRFLVAGPPRSGRSTTLRVLLVEAHRTGVRAVVGATGRSPLTALAHSVGARVIDPGEAADDVGVVPPIRTLLLVDDSEAFLDQVAGERLLSWSRAVDAPLAVVVAGRCDDLATTYRGIAADVRRSHCGLLLRPGPIDGELLGIRLARRSPSCPPGRGVLVGEPSWGVPFDTREPVPVQVATP